MEIFKESEDYVIYAPESLGYVINEEIKILDKTIKRYCDLFGIEKFRKLVLNYFDKKEDFREFIYSLRGVNSLPEYAAGSFDRGMINAFVNPKLVVGSPWYSRALCMSSHELFHIMYKELVCNGVSALRIVWYDEGMALFMSGERFSLEDEGKFKDFYLKLKEDTKGLPNMNELEHGNSFKNENYDGYDLSYLCVRYLYETMSYEDFKSLIYDLDKVISIGENVLNDAFMYFDEKVISKKK